MGELKFITDNSGHGRLALDVQYRERRLAKLVPGARYDNELKLWTMPVSYAGCLSVQGIFGQNLDVHKDVRAYAQDQHRFRAVLLPEMASLGLDVQDERLTDAQVAGVKWLIHARRAILADEMGSGKTVMACQALMNVDREVTLCLVVAPNSTKRGWEKHIRDWTDFEPFLIAGGQKGREKMIDAAIDLAQTDNVAIIVNWEQLRSHTKLKAYGNIRLSEKERESKHFDRHDFDVVIFDEAHRLKNPQSKQSRAARNVALSYDPYVWAMTGTPIANHPGDLWGILAAIDGDEWRSRVAYVDRYCVQQFSPWGGSDIIGVQHNRRDEFYHLLDRYFLRRLKHEVIGRDIAKIPVVRWVELPPKHRKMYNTFRDDLIARIEEGAIAATNPLVATARLTQLAGAPLKQIGDNEYEMVMPSPKVKELLELVNDIGDEQIAVYSASKQLLHLAREALEKADITYVEISGDIPMEDRERAIEIFQAGDVQVFLGVTAAAGEGITLTAARKLVFLQRSWSMVQNLQAEDRIHRYGQEADEVEIIDILAEDTVDERIYDVFVTKQARLDEITRDSLKDLL